MLQEITLTPATVAILLAVLAWAVWAVRRLLNRGMCDCGDKRDGCSGKNRKGSNAPACSGGSAAADMVAKMESSLDAR